MNKDKQFAVLGLGRFGQSLAYTLFENGCNVLACDHDYDIVQEFSSCATHVVQVDITDENAVEALGLGNYDVVIIATGSDMNSSIMATLIAKEKGAKYVIKNGEYIPEKNAYIKFIGIEGKANYAFVGMKAGGRVSTYHIESVAKMIKDGVSLFVS